MVKAYRADWDDTLQPYALYVPADYTPGKKVPLIVALHGAWSDHHHNLRRVFGLDNRPGETELEASRNELPLPDVPAIVVSPLGRGELMGYDGLGGDDVMRVIADVRRAYDVDPERITMTGLSMGGGATWAIGLRHPELFAALAPVCAVADFARLVPDADVPSTICPRSSACRPGRWPITPPTCRSSSSMAPRIRPLPSAIRATWSTGYKALGYLGKNVHYTEYPNVEHSRGSPPTRGRRCCARWRRRSAIRPRPRTATAAARRGDPRAGGQERPASSAAPLCLRHARPG